MFAVGALAAAATKADAYPRVVAQEHPCDKAQVLEGRRGAWWVLSAIADVVRD